MVHIIYDRYIKLKPIKSLIENQTMFGHYVLLPCVLFMLICLKETLNSIFAE